MNVSLAPRQRALLLFVSASAYSAWFAGLGGGGTDAAGFGARPQSAVTLAERPALPPVAAVIERDPFAVPRSPQRPAGYAPAAGVAAQIAVGANAGENSVVVPDIDGRAQPAPGTVTLALRATIVGPDPVAYVASGGAMDIVRVGDTLGDRRVARIELRGIVFGDGTRLDLPGTYEATPKPRTAREGGERISLATLRRLLLPLSGSAPTGGAPAAASPATPQPGATATYPTPAPLPSVNAQELPVGVNPTPNPNNPTAYPYPYPYAPPAPH